MKTLIVFILAGSLLFCLSGCHAKKPSASPQKETQTKTASPEAQGTSDYSHAAPLPLPPLGGSSNTVSSQTSSGGLNNNVSSLINASLQKQGIKWRIKEIADIKKSESVQYPLDVYAEVYMDPDVQANRDWWERYIFHVNSTTGEVSEFVKKW